MTKKHISLERTIGEYNVLSWSIAISTFILYMIITLVGAAAIGFFIYSHPLNTYLISDIQQINLLFIL